MTSNIQRGFTLIELLVVVLIIAILAAIAVPQYQKAVYKSRISEYQTNLQTLAQAATVCELMKGTPCSLEELDIEIPTCTPIPSLFDSCYYGIIGDTKRVNLYIKEGSAESVGFIYHWSLIQTTDGRISEAPITATLQGLYCLTNLFTQEDCAKFGFTEHVIYNRYKRP